VPAHRLVVAAAAVGGARGAAAVDVGDATVTEGDEVVDGLVEPLVVGLEGWASGDPVQALERFRAAFTVPAPPFRPA
jgi:hypothetical protein